MSQLIKQVYPGNLLEDLPQRTDMVPEGFHLVTRWPYKYQTAPEEFHKDAICSDDGVTWYRLSRIGEPGSKSLIAEPDEVEK